MGNDFVSGLADLAETAFSEQSEAAAIRISQHLLDVTGQAFMTRNFDLFAPWFVIPHRISTFEETVTVETVDAMSRTFHRLCDFYAENSVTNLVRTCISARFVSSDRVEATHLSHLMVGNRLLKKAFPAFSVITFDRDRWKVKSSQYALVGTEKHTAALTSGGTPSIPARGPKP